MNESPWSWRTAFPAFAAGWQSFFHGPVDLRLVGWLRASYAVLVLIHLLVLWPDFERWFGEQGLLPPAAADRLLDPLSLTLFRWLPTSDGALQLWFLVAVVQAALLAMGVWPRFNALGSFLWLVSFQQRNPILWDGEDNVLRLLGFYLMFLPLERVPWRFWRTPPTEAAEGTSGWPLRLLQLQMCVIYLDTAAAKMGGETWLDGAAVYFVPRLDEFYREGIVPNLLFEIPWLVRGLTWSVLLLEFGIPVVIWFKETRRAALVAAGLFHLASFATMHLFLFHPIMLVGWLAFTTSDDWNAAARWLSRRDRRPDSA